jgi:hypothetical protein
MSTTFVAAALPGARRRRAMREGNSVTSDLDDEAVEVAEPIGTDQVR